MRASAAAQSRVIFALVVGLAHAVLLWLAWRVHEAHHDTEETFGTLLFFPAPQPAARTDRKHPPRVRRPLAMPNPSFGLPQPRSWLPNESAPAALPAEPLPGATVDWRQQIGPAAAAIIERGREDARRAGALLRKFQPSAAFQPLHEPRHDYAWYAAHSHIVDSADGVPILVLTQPCAVVIFIIRDCTIDHVERHGALFEYMTQEVDATVVYGGPNAVP